jgi:hypothetical protein
MAHVKTLEPGGWGFDRHIVVPVKVSSRGLIGADRRDFLKQASHVFLPFIDNVKFGADMEPVHILALGAYEKWGHNRNGDSFLEKVCRDCHGTFVKYAKWYNHHKNKPPGNTHYGVIGHSAYNDEMARVELLGGLYKTAEAAARARGAVDKEALDMLARGDDVPVSMSCRVPHDECSACHNRARTRDEYCKAATCPAGGCANNLAKVVKMGSDAHHLGVFNPDPVWFDLSRVWRGADRTAYGARADYLTKAAAENGFEVPGALWAETLGVSAPLEALVHGDRATALVKLAHGLDVIERLPARRVDGMAFLDGVCAPATLDVAPGTKEANEYLSALADCGAVLALRDFARLEKKAHLTAAAAGLLPGVYGRAVRDGTVESLAAAPRYALDSEYPSSKARTWASRVKESCSLDPSEVSRRASLASLRGLDVPQTLEKSACQGHDVERLARDYASYKLAALGRIAESSPSVTLTAFFAVAQNRVL